MPPGARLRAGGDHTTASRAHVGRAHVGRITANGIKPRTVYGGRDPRNVATASVRLVRDHR